MLRLVSYFGNYLLKVFLRCLGSSQSLHHDLYSSFHAVLPCKSTPHMHHAASNGQKKQIDGEFINWIRCNNMLWVNSRNGDDPNA
jgi:hypothetical protein